MNSINILITFRSLINVPRLNDLYSPYYSTQGVKGVALTRNIKLSLKHPEIFHSQWALISTIPSKPTGLYLHTQQARCRNTQYCHWAIDVPSLIPAVNLGIKL